MNRRTSEETADLDRSEAQWRDLRFLLSAHNLESPHRPNAHLTRQKLSQPYNHALRKRAAVPRILSSSLRPLK
jgi:hypothetical protein